MLITKDSPLGVATRNILEPLNKKYNVDAMIAGGFVRDNLLGKPFSDVDILVNVKDKEKARAFFKMASLPGLDVEHTYPELNDQVKIVSIHKFPYEFDSLECANPNKYEYKAHNPLDWMKWEINLIVVDFDCGNIKNLHYTIGSGICMCAMTANDLYLADEFIKDVADKQITLYRLDWGHEKSMKHWMKIHKKYPWPLRLPS